MLVRLRILYESHHTDSLIMQRIWAWTQCIVIDASVAGTIIRTFRYSAEGEKVKILIEE